MYIENVTKQRFFSRAAISMAGSRSPPHPPSVCVCVCLCHLERILWLG